MKPTHFYDFDKNLSKSIGFTKILVTVWKSAIRYLYGNTLRKLRNFVATDFSKKFRQINVLLKIELYWKKLIWRKKICVALNFSFFHIFLWGMEYHHFFRQINVFTKEVTKELISRKFFSVIVFYRTFPCTVHGVEITKIYSQAFLVKISLKHLLNKSLQSWFDRKKFWWEQIFHFSTVCCVGGIEIWCCFFLREKIYTWFYISQ